MSGPGPNVVAYYPRLVAAAPPTVELYLALGEGHVGTGTEAFVAELLRDAHVDFTAITRWSLEPYRAYYFSSYPEPEQEWEARWPLAWRVTVELSAPPGLSGSDEDAEYWSQAFDSSASWQEPPPPGAHCLVLADFADRDDAEIARNLLGKDGRIGHMMHRFWQLAIDLGARDDAFYASGAGEAFDLMQRCKDLGATVYYGSTVRRGLTPR